MRILLVNPWIVDVAAYNFWLRPLGLYLLAEWLAERGAEVSLVDCLSPAPAPGKFPATRLTAEEMAVGAPKGLKRYGVNVEEYRRRLKSAGNFDAVLVTSLLSWWHPGAQLAIKETRRFNPKARMAIGGVYPTLWPNHAAEFSGADATFSGPIELCGEELAAFLKLPAAPTNPHTHWWKLGLHDGQPYGGIRSARGCPERCTYCASRKLSDGFQARNAGEVAEELAALWSLGVREVAFYDDALLVGANERVFPAIEQAMATGARFRFQTPNGLHARLLDRKTALKMKALGFTGFRLSLETTDPDRSKATGGKVAKEEVAHAVAALLEAGVPPAAVGVYLLMGLPGQGAGEVEEGIRFVRGLGVRPYLAEFSPIPGTPEWENAKNLGCVADDTDPLWTNNSLYLTTHGGWDAETVRRLKNLARGGK